MAISAISSPMQRMASSALLSMTALWMVSYALPLMFARLTLSGLNSVAAVTQRSRTGLHGQTPSALRRIRLLRAYLNHHDLRSAAGIHIPMISRAGCRDAQPRSSHHGSEPDTIGGATHTAGTPG